MGHITARSEYPSREPCVGIMRCLAVTIGRAWVQGIHGYRACMGTGQAGHGRQGSSVMGKQWA